MQCINISSDLHVKLRFEGFPIPFQIVRISKSIGSKIRNLDLLTNLTNYYRNITNKNVIEPLKDLLRLVYLCPRGKCKYFTCTFNLPFNCAVLEMQLIIY